MNALIAATYVVQVLGLALGGLALYMAVRLAGETRDIRQQANRDRLWLIRLDGKTRDDRKGL